MSLENEIKELNETIKILINTLQNKDAREPAVMASAPEKAPEQAVETIEVAPTFEQVQTAFVKFIAEKGRDSALALLKRHDVDGKLTEGKLPASGYAAFIEDCRL